MYHNLKVKAATEGCRGGRAALVPRGNPFVGHCTRQSDLVYLRHSGGLAIFFGVCKYASRTLNTSFSASKTIPEVHNCPANFGA
jgi:hypothetical protein